MPAEYAEVRTKRGGADAERVLLGLCRPVGHSICRLLLSLTRAQHELASGVGQGVFAFAHPRHHLLHHASHDA